MGFETATGTKLIFRAMYEALSIPAPWDLRLRLHPEYDRCLSYLAFNSRSVGFETATRLPPLQPLTMSLPFNSRSVGFETATRDPPNMWP